MLPGINGEITPERRKRSKTTSRKQKQHPVVDVPGYGSKVQCFKEQYYIVTWNVRPMNQGKLEMVKQYGKSEH